MITCKECTSNKIYAKGLCSRCYGRYSMRKFRLFNPEKDRKRKRDWYQLHKNEFCIIRKKSRILKKYGLTLEQYELLKNNQKDECLICHGVKILVLDHSHETGKLRGMLCDLCNRGLGYFKDDPKLLINAAEYIINSNKLKETVKWTRI